MRRAIDFGYDSADQWLNSIAAGDYQELLELAEIEPIGSDAIVLQIAQLCAIMGGEGTKLSDVYVLSTEHEQTAEDLARKMGWPNGNN